MFFKMLLASVTKNVLVSALGKFNNAFYFIQNAETTAFWLHAANYVKRVQ